MAIRIRLYPQTGGAFGAYGRTGAVSAQTYYTQKLQTQQQISNLKLGYERALWNEKLQTVRLEERLKNPHAMYQGGQQLGYGAYPVQGAYNPYAAGMLGNSLLNSGSNFFGGLGLGRMF